MLKRILVTTAGLFALAGCHYGNYPHPTKEGRVIRADVVALDQPITYNRFGSFNPYGMIYALANDVEIEEIGFDQEKFKIGRSRNGGYDDLRSTCPGLVRLKADIRPRPLVLRGNEGDRLQVRFTNYLLPNDRSDWGPSGQPNMSRCNWGDIEPAKPESAYDPFPPPFPNDDYDLDHGNHTIQARLEAAEEEAADHAGEPEAPTADDIITEHDTTNWPRTRTASFVASGLTAVRGIECDVHDADPGNDALWHNASDPRVTGIQPIAPNECFIYEYALGEPGTHLFFSLGAPSGGQGDGGSLTHGLFGSVNVQPKGSRYYRSQVTEDIMAEARSQAEGKALINYEALAEDGSPLLNILQKAPGMPGLYDLVHGDLNAVIVDCGTNNRHAEHCQGVEQAAFREFTVIFHDELKTFYPEPLKELGEEYQFEGIGDGFAINYGASGMGSILLANRKGFGPAQNCLECVYEEFFLQSWANGDPALLVTYEDDPANVHHSYLGDRVEFRNLHAGPKETHVFHLHAHQWLAERDDPTEAENFGTYLDSQTIAPQQGFAYNIYYGGSGNRNQTVGDSIFHCHLYPHFAQGMWALWRVHDVFEDGSRALPDGEAGGGTDPFTGITDGGTPIPALVPLPKQAMPPYPTYAADVGEDDVAMPGYPFYIPGRAGHRAPQPPLDIAKDDDGNWLDGGMPRHIFADGGTRVFGELSLEEQQRMSPEELVQYALRAGDFSVNVQSAKIDLLDNDGVTSELDAMAFHAGQATSFKRADGTPAAAYSSITPEGQEEIFHVNKAPPQPGAPFADPCRADFDENGYPDDETTFKRLIRYDVSAIQLDLIVNKAGWHDPQARINVLSKDAEALEFKTTGDVDPFFFRANSRDCIEFRHTNRTPKDLELDDFQVKTPTDIIGQHIHLVKFDVTSSDGSGNGFNYEDGTLAPDEVKHRIELFNASLSDKAKPLAMPDETFQTTVQRWYADPLLSGEGGTDRTIRTVFTHDHFAPSSIQHHGFYSALLIEPKGSNWHNAAGEPMCPEKILEDQTTEPCESDIVAVGAKAIISDADDPKTHADHREFAMAIADFALLYEPRRENAYHEDAEAKDQGLDNLLAALEASDADTKLPPAAIAKAEEAVGKRRNTVRERHGVPVDPPLLPESISKNHHNPYLVNYKNEPLGHRVGENGPDATPDAACDDVIRGFVTTEDAYGLPAFETVSVFNGNAGDRLDSLRDGKGTLGENRLDGPDKRPDGWAWLEGRNSVDQQRMDARGDMANVFSSDLHGDPCTPVVEGYEGERLQIRMIQGAQEVQHMVEIQGMSWPREIANPESPKVAAQEIGISEHFEFDLPLKSANTDSVAVDYLYRFSTVDALWNGAWGLTRVYGGNDRNDQTACPIGGDSCPAIGERLKPVAEIDDPASAPGSFEVDIDGPLPTTMAARDGSCPLDAPIRLHVVDAVTVSDVLGDDPRGWPKVLFYNSDHSISDPDALAFMPIFSKLYEGQTFQSFAQAGWQELWLEADETPVPGAELAPIDVQELANGIRDGRLDERALYENGDKTFEPMVLRARAGECVIVRLRNLLLHDVDHDGGFLKVRDKVEDNDDVEAHLQGQEGYDPRHLPRIFPLNAVELQASSIVGITPQKMNMNVGEKGGALIGRNQDQTLARETTAFPNEAITYRWYAGELTLEAVDSEPGTVRKAWSCEPDAEACEALGAVNLVSLTDVIEHGQQGLIAALVIEERDAEAYDPLSARWRDDWLPNGTRARIDPDGVDGKAEPMHEFVLIYQDGLNLRWHNPDRPYSSDIEAVPDCLVCDDSYDRGEKAVNYRTEPFWARLRRHPTTDLNGEIFDERFFLDGWKTIATPGFEVTEGDKVTFHVLQPYGRARQRAFMVLGHDYLDLLPFFGSRHSALVSVGKAVKAEIGTTKEPGSQKAAQGHWIWRDGPAQHFSSGAWGRFEVKAK